MAAMLKLFEGRCRRGALAAQAASGTQAFNISRSG
jgi:hypothetical protein